MTKYFYLLDLRPTQLALGMLEVKRRVKALAKSERKQLKKIVKKCPITVVVAPNGMHYIVDGHHHACVFWLLGVKKVSLRILKDFSGSRLSYKAFWHQMRVHKWIYLYD